MYKTISWILVGSFTLGFLTSCSASKANTNDRIELANTNAKPNDGIDDTKIIKASLNALSHSGGTLVFEKGVYDISDEIILEFVGNDKNLRIDGNGATVKTAGFQRYIFYFINKGQNNNLFIQNFNIDGSATAETRKIYLDSSLFTFGVRTMEFTKVFVEGCHFKNIYGTGLRLNFRRISDASQNQMPEYFEVSKCSFENCSGLNLIKDVKKTRDNYGDGCSVYGGRNGVIKDCKIVNNLDVTGHMGRAGFATFGSSINIEVLQDTIQGYDRAVHIENTFGGHKVNKCYITDCNVGLIINASKCPYLSNNPIYFNENHITGTTRDRSKYGGSVKPPAMITFIGSSDLFTGSEFNNNYIRDGKTGANHFAIIIHQAGIHMNNNQILGSSDRSSSMYIEKKLKSFTNNTIKDYFKVYLRGGSETISDNTLTNVQKKMIKKSK